MGIVIRLAISAVSLWLATALFKGITLTGTTGHKVLSIILVAVLFGVINALLRPIIKTIGCWAYLLTLGLISLVVNGALLMLTSWVAGQADLGFHVDKFWPTAILAALFIGIDRKKNNQDRRQPPPPQSSYQGGRYR
jgi:putative membrane protein